MIVALLLLVAALLVAASAVFVAAEFSLVAVDRPTVERRAAEGDRRAAGVLAALRGLSFQLSGAQLGITVTSLAVGYLAEPSLAVVLRGVGVPGAVAVALSLIVATLVAMIFGELVPKNLAISRPFSVAAAVAGPQRAFSVAAGPLIAGLNGVAERIARKLGVEPTEELQSARAPQELASLVRRSAEAGTLPDRVASLVDRTLRFGDKNAGDAMTPRSRLEVLDANATVADLVSRACSTGHTRFPVTRDGLDDVIGVVHVRAAVTTPYDTPVEELITPVLAVPEALELERLLPRMRDDHLAVVIDEYGGTAGIVTLEDLLEELVGEVHDEHDADRPPATPRPRGWELDGLLRIDEVADITGVELPQGPYDTIAGLVVHRLGRLAHAGDTVDLDRARLIVARTQNRRVDRVVLEPEDDAS